MPELAIDPGDTGDEAIGFDGAEYGTGFRIDLMDLAIMVLADPERPFSPGEPRIPAIAGRRNCAEHRPGFGIDLAYHGLGDLEQVLSVERRSRMRGDIKRPDDFPAFRIEGVQPVAGGEPYSLPVKADPVHAIDFGERSIFAKDFGACVFHVLVLPARQRGRE